MATRTILKMIRAQNKSKKNLKLKLPLLSTDRKQVFLLPILFSYGFYMKGIGIMAAFQIMGRK